MRLVIMLLALLPAGTLRAAPPALKLTAPKEARPADRFIEVTASAPGPVVWDVSGFPNLKVRVYGTALVVGVPDAPGTVHVVCTAPGAAGKAPLLAAADVVIKVNAPTPPPAPKPDPAPAPKEIALHCYVVATGVDAAPANAPALRRGASDLGIDVRVFSPDGSAVKDLGLADAVKQAGGAPCVLLVDDAGLVHAAEKLPGKSDDLLALLARVKESAK